MAAISPLWFRLPLLRSCLSGSPLYHRLRSRGGKCMDILMLVDRLEAVINSGWRMPMTSRVQIDERDVLDVLDLMRTTVPEEIKQARRVNQEREKILAQAQTEANRLVSQAQERVERLVSEDNILQVAEQRAHDIVLRAQDDAEEVRRGAD